MFGIGMPELVLIFVIALLIFGPAELPKIAKNLGRIMGEFKRTSDDLMGQIQQEIEAVGAEETHAPAAGPTAPFPEAQDVAHVAAAPPAEASPEAGPPGAPAPEGPGAPPEAARQEDMAAGEPASPLAEKPAGVTDPAERLRRVHKLLGDLKVTEEYLRQYPALAEKVAALMEAAGSAQERP